MRQAGFSLVELIITMIIFTLLAHIGIGEWLKLKLRDELIITTEQLATFLSQVQMEANTNNLNYSLNLFEQPFWCLTTNNPKTDKNKQVIDSCTGELIYKKPLNSVIITNFTDKKTITFWGLHDMASTFSFHLQNEIGLTKVIISFKGRIRFCSVNMQLGQIPLC